MAIKSQAQIQAESNSTYVDNTVGSITPANVRALNTNWIDSIIYVEQTGSLRVDFATSASQAATASFLIGSIASASFANTAVSASQAEFANTASLALQNIVTASAVANILTFTKGNGTTFNVTIAQSGSVASASYADVANFANSAGTSVSSSYAYTASSAERATSASFSVSASRAISAVSATSATTATSATSAGTAISASFASTAGTANTASFAPAYAALAGNNTFTGITTFNNNVTMSNVLITSTASIQYLNVVFQSSSIIYSSGSNQLGDAANDTQTLWGTVNVISGPLVVTGSSNFKSAFTASGLNYPTADGVADQFVTTNGAGTLSFDWVKTLHQNIRNRESVSIVRGTPLFVSGSTGDNADVYIADASNPSRRPATLIAYDATLAASATGTAIISGEIQGVDTTGYAAGTVIYLAAGGGWTSTRPIGSASVQVLGVVTLEGINGRGLVFNQVADLLPNITQGYTWVGDANAVPQPVTTSSLSVASAVSSSYALSASFATSADSAITAGNANFASTATSASYSETAATASFTPNAVVSARTYIISSSIKFERGDGSADFVIVDNVQSASFADNAATASVLLGSVVSASYALSASFAEETDYAVTSGNANFAITATSASYALSASWSDTSGVANSATTATSATSASFAQTSITASFATNFINSGSYVITGSHRGNVVSQSIASSTASFDFSTGNFFTLNLTGSVLTHISASNIQAGQTVNVRISQGATTGSVSFSPAFDQVSGSAYVPTQVANAVDILTFITFDNSLVYVSNIKNLV